MKTNDPRVDGPSFQPTRSTDRDQTGPVKTNAERSYEAYAHSLGWMNLEGKTLPDWYSLPPRIQIAVRAAVKVLEPDCYHSPEAAEQLRVQLAGCSTAALGCTHARQVATEGMYGWSPAYADVLKLRHAFDAISGGRSPDEVLKTVERDIALNVKGPETTHIHCGCGRSYRIAFVK